MTTNGYSENTKRLDSVIPTKLLVGILILSLHGSHRRTVQCSTSNQHNLVLSKLQPRNPSNHEPRTTNNNDSAKTESVTDFLQKKYFRGQKLLPISEVVSNPLWSFGIPFLSISLMLGPVNPYDVESCFMLLAWKSGNSSFWTSFRILFFNDKLWWLSCEP